MLYCMDVAGINNTLPQKLSRNVVVMKHFLRFSPPCHAGLARHMVLRWSDDKELMEAESTMQ